ncbi:hypothetical protein QTI66_30960 [Variovorax sp. J22R133]|uniref:hypothetical protein n=1 Tax=Variovorax brevis TaxID=3053503 RepID=UPI0025789351|nr:hypothetical protein [Variovorax sp. J22R133]MDM0116570.1 hypothetical protein [Variovorax sp. J22R133]
MHLRRHGTAWLTRSRPARNAQVGDVGPFTLQYGRMRVSFCNYYGVLMRNVALSSVAVACAILVSACGGGSGGGSGGTNPPPATSTKVDVKVVDGAISNATVFLDLNGNGALDAGEPTARTNASGVATLDVPNGNVGTAPVVALVGTDAVDADSGPVPVAFKLTAPKDSTGVVSPLTTIVQHMVKENGMTTTEAAAAAQAQAGLNVSMLADFTANSSADGKVAATAARLFVVSVQQYTNSLSPAAGTTDLSGAPITQADIDKTILAKAVETFPAMTQVAKSPDVQAACATMSADTCKSEVASSAADVNAASGLTTDSLPLVVAAARAPVVNASGVAGATLQFMNFIDASNWSYRIFMANAEENTPDADGNTRYRSYSRAMTGGALQEWASGSSFNRRGDRHWDGSEWSACDLGHQNVQSRRDANGRVAANNYCNGLEFSSSTRSEIDISDKKIADIVAVIQSSLPSYATWGAAPVGYPGVSTANYGTATFPPGSKLLSQSSTSSQTAFAFDVTAPLFSYNDAIAAGADTRGNPGTACSSPEAQVGPALPVTTLEGMIAKFKGTPCVYGQHFIGNNISSPNPSEWWGQSTLSVGIVGTAPVLSNPTTFFTGNTYVRFAFKDGNTIAYYSCQQQHVNRSERNCVQIGTGTYSIQTLGDSRVLTISNPPSASAPLDYERIYVENGGQVFYGYKSKLRTTFSTRLNLEGTNAVFTQIGIPTVTP